MSAKLRFHTKQNYLFKTLLSIYLLSTGSFFAIPANAETLAIPEQTKPFEVTLPGRGMTMTEVLGKFGDPVSKDPEVGEPPISRWYYNNFVVVFEYQYVIHALIPKKPVQIPESEINTTIDKQMPMENSATPDSK